MLTNFFTALLISTDICEIMNIAWVNIVHKPVCLLLKNTLNKYGIPQILEGFPGALEGKESTAMRETQVRYLGRAGYAEFQRCPIMHVKSEEKGVFQNDFLLLTWKDTGENQ